MDIETVAHDSPEAIVTHSIDIDVGLKLKDALKVAGDIGFVNEAKEEVLLEFN